MKRHHLLCHLGLLAVVLFAQVGPAQGQTSPYTSIVVFGDSLSDTGNDAAVSAAKYTAAGQVPGVATGYTNGRFTDGLDTTPAARLYTGVWIEQVAAQLTNHPAVTNSLAGGTNYSYGFATTDVGTSLFTYGPGNALSFSVNNMGQQVSDYLATNPTIDNKVLFVVWGGANDLIAATSPADIVNAAARDANLVQQLITAGATNVVVPILPPLGLVPRFNGSATTAATVTGAAEAYNQALGADLDQLALNNAGKMLNIYYLDTATLFNAIVASPANYGFANVTASSQLNTAVNPDTYLFWDDLHPTTAGHHLIAVNALRLLGTPVATNTALSLSSASANLKANVTLTATVTNASGGTDTPIGTVTFTDAGAPLGTGVLVGSGASATASLSTSSLAAGVHPIEASYLSVNGFGGSVSGFTTETIIPPSFSATLSPATQTVSRGSGGSTTVSIAPVGGYTGSFTVSCGAGPAHFSCTVQNPALSITGTTAVTTTVSFSTNVAANQVPSLRGETDRTVLAFFGFPLLGGVALIARRRRRFAGSLALMGGVLVLSFASVVGFSGCAGGSDPFANDTPTGTYQIPVVVTPATGAATNLTLDVVVQ